MAAVVFAGRVLLAAAFAVAGAAKLGDLKGSRTAAAAMRRVVAVATALLLGLFVAFASSTSAQTLVADNPLGAHSMLYSPTPAPFKDAMFRYARGMGASEIRVSVEYSDVFANSPVVPNWTLLNQYMWYAAVYHIRVLAILDATPIYLANCPIGTSGPWWHCGTNNPDLYAWQAGQIAAHVKGYIDDFEILNECDGTSAYSGTVGQYASMLSKSADAIHAANRTARVMNCGFMDARPDAFAASLFSTQGANIAHKIDVAAVHIREWGDTAKLAGDVKAWKAFFTKYGFQGPLWVTEHGYPADPVNQYDKAYHGKTLADGLVQQSRYLQASVPALVGAGVSKVFVTERDNLGGAFGSEGVLGGKVQDPIGPGPTYDIIVKPGFTALRAMVPRLTSLARAAAAKHGRRVSSKHGRRVSSNRRPRTGTVRVAGQVRTVRWRGNSRRSRRRAANHGVSSLGRSRHTVHLRTPRSSTPS